MSDRSLTSVPVHVGEWSPERVLANRGRCLLVVLEGLLIRELAIGDIVTAELHGPGDVLVHRVGVDSYLPQQASWTAPIPGRVGIVDVATAVASPTWPQTSARLVEDLVTQLRRSSELTAIGHLPRVEDRVVGLMWHLAERFGRVGPEGTIVPIALTHASIGSLVGARRPTVSLALKQLAADDTVVRREDGSWLLHGDSARALHPEGAPDDELSDPRPAGL